MPNYTPDPSSPWYSDATVGRDRTLVLEGREGNWTQVCGPDSRFVLQTRHGMVYQHDANKPPKAKFWTFEELSTIVPIKESILTSENPKQFLVWLGALDGQQYWTFYQADFELEQLPSATTLQIAGLRDFGDSLMESTEAALLATSNGLVMFHTSHPFCSQCGSRTRITKAGGARGCLDAQCKTSVYPRMDVAAIMLVTSNCQQYALLGRKANWPPGRYSTLAGFAEVGETMEQCCIRETLEESGVAVDPSSVKFVCSQPWPFPRSFMVGFRATALATQDGKLPTIVREEEEMQDIQWFHKDYVRERLDGGSTASNFQPNEREREFHIPGPASLARILITQWANEE